MMMAVCFGVDYGNTTKELGLQLRMGEGGGCPESAFVSRGKWGRKTHAGYTPIRHVAPERKHRSGICEHAQKI